jgi:molybdate transport system substrate-binding protein
MVSDRQKVVQKIYRIMRYRLVLCYVCIVFSLAACNPCGALVPPATEPEPAPRGAPDSPPSGEITVAAAADLNFAFIELATLFEAETGHRVTLVFGSTGQLAQQIENGAPYDLFAAANVAFVENLRDQGYIVPGSVALYGRGRIVLAVNRGATLEVTTLEELLQPEIPFIAIANPDHAPYGMAAKQALQSAGIWDAVQPKLVLGENVRQTLQYIQSGDAPAGIVALSIAGVPEIAWTLLDEELHEPLDQALGVVATSPEQAIATAFAQFINSEVGRPIMQRYGFGLPGEEIILPQSSD